MANDSRLITLATTKGRIENATNPECRPCEAASILATPKKLKRNRGE
jgi:hypothetical protein